MTRDPEHSDGHLGPHADAPLADPALAFPLDPALHRALADTRHAAGDELGAVAHLIAAHTLDAYASGSAEASAANLCDVATGYFMKGDLDIAAGWYQLVLTLDPSVAIACQNLAAIHASAGRTAEADAFRERAYRIQRVFVEEAPGQVRRVLVLCAARASGNVPFEALLPGAVNCRIKYAIDYAADADDEQLPPFDLVFNAIGEPDIAAPLTGRLTRFTSRVTHPVLNPPAAIEPTARNRTPALLGELHDVQLAACARIDAAPSSDVALAGLLAEHGIARPVLARPAATHGGEGLVRCDSLAALQARLRESPCPQYLTAFRDTRSADGYYRKYRMIFVDRQPIPYHLAISPKWMVHYESSGMDAHPDRLAEEMRFLDDPATALGEAAMAAVAQVGAALDLDYGGIDFSLLPDGRALLFEANATMLVHPEAPDGPYAHKNPAIERIYAAFRAMLAARPA